VTKLQQAAYDAQMATSLPVSGLALAVLTNNNGIITYQRCASYVHAVQQMDWFVTGFPSHSDHQIVVVGGRGGSSADAAQRGIKIGADDRHDVRACEHACLHELAHIVTSDYGPDGERREPERGRRSSKGHHHAWRANFVFIVQNMFSTELVNQLRREFSLWGPPNQQVTVRVASLGASWCCVVVAACSMNF
jgi:hypothetical protein